MQSLRTLTRTWFTVASTVAAIALVSHPARAQLSNYAELDRIEAPFVDFNTIAIRPMVLNGNSLYAINTHDSTLINFNGATTNGPWALPWGPVAIAKWAHSGSAVQFVVVCRNSSCVVRVDTSGNILGLVPLIACSPSDGSSSSDSGGPVGAGDVIVDSVHDMAYVSCTWIDAVVQIDLTSDTVTKRWDEGINSKFRMKAPLFLSFVVDGPEFLVAPMLSGNNTTVEPGTGDTTPVVEGPKTTKTLVSLDAEMNLEDQLPDEDLFLIDPDETASSSAAVTPVARRAGTILFAHGKNPSTGAYWMLNTEAINADSAMQTEPTINGKFAKTRLTILTNLYGTTISDGQDIGHNAIKILDKMGSSQNISPGQPFALAFHKLSTSAHYGKAYVCGLLNDKVVRLNSDGTYDAALILPATTGYIPRGLLLNGSETILLVYCWGTNKVLAYNISVFSNSPTSAATVLGTYDLGYDPAPDAVKHGREIFYDGTRSHDHNLSCASCHIDGRTDQVTWNLSNATSGASMKGPDDKGPMVTQTLAGIERMTPFHWRGERKLDDFNGAFEALLGNSSTLNPTTELPDFERFIFSIQNPANPFEHRDRMISEDIDLGLPAGISEDPDAGAGQDTFRNELTFFEVAGSINSKTLHCNDCHAQPSGTVNDIWLDFPDVENPRRHDFKPAPFVEPWVKRQSRVTLGDSSHLIARPYLGTGISHSGLMPDVFSFIKVIGLSDTDDANVSSFIQQWDQGIAPAAHFSFFLNDGSHASTQLDYLEDQVTARNCDAVIFGTAKIGGSLVPTRWFWDRNVSPAVFRSQGNVTRSLQDFRDGADNDGEVNVVIGVPPGMSRRFGVDYDMDGILNDSDSSKYTPGTPTGDSTAPTFTRGPATVYHSARVARLGWQTSEPAKIDLEWKEGSGSAVSVSIDEYSVSSTYLLTDLRPSTATGDGVLYSSESVSYSWRVRPTDKAGNVGSWSSWISLTTKDFIEPQYLSSSGFPPGLKAMILDQHVVRSLGDLQLTTIDSDTGQFHIDIEVGLKRGGPPGSIDAPKRTVIARAFVKRSPSVEFKPAADESVSVAKLGTTEKVDTVSADSNALNVGSGPFLVSALTSSGGATGIDFQLDGLASGDEVMLNIEAIVEYTSTTTAFSSLFPTSALNLVTGLRDAFAAWDFPTTKEARASKTVTF